MKSEQERVLRLARELARAAGADRDAPAQRRARDPRVFWTQWLDLARYVDEKYEPKKSRKSRSQ